MWKLFSWIQTSYIRVFESFLRTKRFDGKDIGQISKPKNSHFSEYEIERGKYEIELSSESSEN